MSRKGESVYWSTLGSGLLLVAAFNSFGSCSTTDLAAPKPAQPPEYVGVPHPTGFDLADLNAIFFEKGAPAPESLKGCDAPFQRLKERTRNNDELRDGTYELVKQEPVAMHYCFFGKLLELENALKGEQYIDEKQAATIQTYSFLTPIARAFAHEFNDSRYLRWAVQRYRHTSAWFFYRKLELTPKASTELVEAAQPFGLWRAVGEKKPVLEKYGVLNGGSGGGSAVAGGADANAGAGSAAASGTPVAASAPAGGAPGAAPTAPEPGVGGASTSAAAAPAAQPSDSPAAVAGTVTESPARAPASQNAGAPSGAVAQPGSAAAQSSDSPAAASAVSESPARAPASPSK